MVTWGSRSSGRGLPEEESGGAGNQSRSENGDSPDSIPERSRGPETHLPCVRQVP